MITKEVITPRLAIAVLTVISSLLIATVIYLYFFAAQGARYTAKDGDIEKVARIEGDIRLAESIEQQAKRITALEAKLLRITEQQ